MNDGNPLELLGLGPNATLADVKRAYFGLLPAHPPERDPDGFRRLRDAYDTLRKPGALERAARVQGFSRADALAELDARLGPVIEAATAAHAEVAGAQELDARLDALLAESTWAELIAWGETVDGSPRDH